MLKSISNSWPDFSKITREVISQNNIKSVLEVGGGANPYLTKDQVAENSLEYTVLDVDQDELDKEQGNYYKKNCLDITSQPLDETYDLIFSHMLLEHIPNPDDFHRSLKSHLKPEGTIMHFFATKYSLASTANFILPRFIKDFIIYKIQKRDPQKDKRFKAYYRNSMGPTNRMKSYFNDLGFEVVDYRGYYGHGYLSRFRSLYLFENAYNKVVRWINSPLLCSNAIVVLRKL